MGKALVGCLGVLAAIATILALLVSLNVIHPFSSPTPPTLIVSPSSIKAETCPHSSSTIGSSIVHTVYDCKVALSVAGQGNLQWAASGGQGYVTQFTPQQGTLQPGQSVTVDIVLAVNSTLYSKPCPTPVNLIFTNETNPSDTATVAWSC